LVVLYLGLTLLVAWVVGLSALPVWLKGLLYTLLSGFAGFASHRTNKRYRAGRSPWSMKEPERG
jgi:hypothetical protein